MPAFYALNVNTCKALRGINQVRPNISGAPPRCGFLRYLLVYHRISTPNSTYLSHIYPYGVLTLMFATTFDHRLKDIGCENWSSSGCPVSCSRNALGYLNMQLVSLSRGCVWLHYSSVRLILPFMVAKILFGF